jgi:hypothetical protein
MRVVMNAFFAAAAASGVVEPESNQQIRREADQFPADEQQEQAVRDEQPSMAAANRLRKQKNACRFGSCLHVAVLKMKISRPDEGDHHAHERGERIEQPAEPERAAAEFEPGEVVHLMGRRVPQRGEERQARHDECSTHRTDGRTRGERATAARRQRADPRGEQREERE